MLAAIDQAAQLSFLRLVQFNPVAYVHECPCDAGTTMNQADDRPRPVFTPLQGQYLAFIHAYTLVNGQPPAEHEMMRFFQVTPPSVHRMVVALEQAGLISRQPGQPRTIAVRVHEKDLPRLKPGFGQTVKTTVQRY